MTGPELADSKWLSFSSRSSYTWWILHELSACGWQISHECVLALDSILPLPPEQIEDKLHQESIRGSAANHSGGASVEPGLSLLQQHIECLRLVVRQEDLAIGQWVAVPMFLSDIDGDAGVAAEENNTLMYATVVKVLQHCVRVQIGGDRTKEVVLALVSCFDRGPSIADVDFALVLFDPSANGGAADGAAVDGEANAEGKTPDTVPTVADIVKLLQDVLQLQDPRARKAAFRKLYLATHPDKHMQASEDERAHYSKLFCLVQETGEHQWIPAWALAEIAGGDGKPAPQPDYRPRSDL